MRWRFPKRSGPRQFVIPCHQLLGNGGSVAQLQKSAQALGLLGFNTVDAYWWDAIPTSQINQILNANGLTRRLAAIYQPPSYFAYAKDKMNAAELDKIAPETMAQVGVSGGSLKDIVQVHISDEPGWYYPTQLDEVRNNPAYLQEFRAYLKTQNLAPREFGRSRLERGVSPGRRRGEYSGQRLARKAPLVLLDDEVFLRQRGARFETFPRSDGARRRTRAASSGQLEQLRQLVVSRFAERKNRQQPNRQSRFGDGRSGLVRFGPHQRAHDLVGRLVSRSKRANLVVLRRLAPQRRK